MRTLGAALALWATDMSAAEPTAEAQPPAAEPAQKLDAINVEAFRYRPVSPDLAPGSFGPLGLEPFPVPTIEGSLMGAFVVTATRAPQATRDSPMTVHIVEAAGLKSSPTATIDTALRSVPGFSLFRRSDSLIAHPTAQGVSLRGVGPSGASRSLVLLDGVPLNDPFGGWVNWGKVPRDALARIEVVSGTGAAAWGNAALGGAIQLFTAPPRVEAIILDRPPAPIAWGSRGTLAFSAFVGDFQTRGADLVINRPFHRGILQVVLDDFATSGFSVIRADQRGPIDVNAWSRHSSLAARWRRAVSKTVEFTVATRWFEETRGNGTPYQRNANREKFVSLQFYGEPTQSIRWRAIAYAQQQTFSSTFSAVNVSRTAETPASDQFGVPATSLGASATSTWLWDRQGRTIVGADVRALHGETRENFSYRNGGFTRQRFAGGTQAFAGAFVSDTHAPTPTVRLTIGGRLDTWDESNGRRNESDRTTNTVLREERYPGKRSAEFSPNAGLVWTPGSDWRFRANAQHAFRRPTLNELYRPFRQGSNIIEANPNLATEHATSAEAGAEWTLWAPTEKASAPPPKMPIFPTARVGPKPRLTAAVTGFWNELDDAVANVTVARGPGTHPLFGTLPAGTVGRQRLNLDKARIQGVEAKLTSVVGARLGLEASYLYNDAIVRRADVAPALVGKRLAEVPRHAAALTTIWSLPANVMLTGRVRYIGRQYDDDENTLRLGAAVVGDVGVTWPATKHLELFLNVENVGNVRVETARTADGIVSVGTPRLALVGVRGKW